MTKCTKNQQVLWNTGRIVEKLSTSKKAEFRKKVSYTQSYQRYPQKKAVDNEVYIVKEKNIGFVYMGKS